ncbi:MAG: hypothetical protein R3F30_01220 [Planctomycetota bacterium]
MQDETPRNDDSRPKGLSSAEYRQRLLHKLDCLISVLEVAIGKIANTMEGPEANVDRLNRIKSNLENTLAICRRAKGTLQSRIASESNAGPAQGTGERPSPRTNATFRSYVELSSIDEFRKFKGLKAITRDEIGEVDLDELARKFFSQDA